MRDAAPSKETWTAEEITDIKRRASQRMQKFGLTPSEDSLEFQADGEAVARPQHSRVVAEAIAADLFVNGAGEEAQRLVLTVDTPTPRDLGGWGKEPLIERIERRLRAAEKDQP